MRDLTNREIIGGLLDPHEYEREEVLRQVRDYNFRVIANDLLSRLGHYKHWKLAAQSLGELTKSDPGYTRTSYISRKAARALGDREYNRVRGAVKTFRGMGHTPDHVKVALGYVIPALGYERRDGAVKAIVGMAHTSAHAREISKTLSPAMKKIRLQEGTTEAYVRIARRAEHTHEILPSLADALKDKRHVTAAEIIDRISRSGAHVTKISRALSLAVLTPSSRDAATKAFIRLVNRFPPKIDRSPIVADLAYLHMDPTTQGAVERVIEGCKIRRRLRGLVEYKKRAKNREWIDVRRRRHKVAK